MDVNDVAPIFCACITLQLSLDIVMNIANRRSVSVMEFVSIMLLALGLKANFVRVPTGQEYQIDIEPMLTFASLVHVSFGFDYLNRAVRKYFD
jgi:hypothetical protein